MKPSKGYSLPIFLLFILCEFVSVGLKAQPRADFVLDQSSGCAPLTVKFTNATSGASSNALWQWDFGNGNNSFEKNPSANFLNETTYTIRLTVKDGSFTSTQTKTVTVYKRPVFEFSVDPAGGCTPMQTTFNAKQTAGDGQINKWHWDFGDGQTAESRLPVINHTYNFRQTASVTLTAVSEYGCASTLVKEKIIRVSDPVSVSFNADKKFLCDPGTVSFVNNSTGAGSLSYQWDFGDGTVSTEKQPAHSYTSSGLFTIKLKVKSSEGCEITKTETDFINVKNFSTDFTLPEKPCESDYLFFTNKSSPEPDNSDWYVNGTLVLSYPNINLGYQFPKAASYKVKLVNTFGACKQEQEKIISIKKNPKIDSFICEIPKFCNVPVEIKFRDTSSEAVKWNWNFDYYRGSAQVEGTVRNPSFKFPYATVYVVRLEIENNDGCRSEIFKNIDLTKPWVGIEMMDANGYFQCDSLVKQYRINSPVPVVSQRWSFGDGTFSNEKEPVHTYNKPGVYAPSVTYTNAEGCTETLSGHFSVTVYEKPTVNFTAQSVACGFNRVEVYPQITGYNQYYYWEWGDGTRSGWNDYYHNVHQYQDTGVYSVTLITYNGYCNDTMTKNNIVTIKGPFPKIEKVDYSCEGERTTVVIHDATRHAKKWTWDFGDGKKESYTSYQPTISHTYSKTGTYVVKLIAENDNCILRDSVEVLIMKKQRLQLTLDNETICLYGQENFSVKTPDPDINKIGGYYWGYRSIQWQITGGRLFDGNYYDNGGWDSRVAFTGVIYPYAIVKDSVRLIMTNYLNGSYCNDTSNFAAIDVRGVNTDFDILANEICFKNPVVLKDKSTASGAGIVSRVWDLGDGTTITKSGAENISHYYTDPGIYVVRLTATDSLGCSDSRTSDYTVVRAYGVKAGFYTSAGTEFPKQTDVTFYNSSYTGYQRGNVKYKWNFGDGSTSNEQSPEHAYAAAGTYNVQLIAIDEGISCPDTLQVAVTVTEVTPNAAFYSTISYIGDYGACAPAQANFVFNSNISYTRLSWDFGDGFKMENLNNVSHIYTRAGQYEVTLQVFNGNSLLKTYKENVRISLPSAKLEAPDKSVCIGEAVILNAPEKKNGYKYTWDFGNGAVISSSDSVAQYKYANAGSYTPSLVVRDGAGCAASVSLPEKIVVHPDPVAVISPQDGVVCKGNGVQLQASGGRLYEWTQIPGLSSYSIANPLANPPTNTTYHVTATDQHGCKGSASVTIKLAQPVSLSYSPAVDVCIGKQAQLSSSGADLYQWINTTAGLSNTTIANPVVNAAATTTYTLVGYDQYRCYTDTGQVTVHVQPLPAVDAGPDQQVNVGEETRLVTSGSGDITRWQWTPADYLGCSSCASPVVKPYSTKEYTVTVFNKYNCQASDQVKVTAICPNSVAYIPNAFTPNGDGLNDVFRIPPVGVSKIHFFRIYNNWGQIIFEKKDFFPADPAGEWDGRLKGVALPAGVYIYHAEMECAAGERFQKKGTVTLIR